MRTNVKRLLPCLLVAVLIMGLQPTVSNAEAPQYGGTLQIISQYPYIPALSWDNYDWNWKHAHDTGLVLEHLLVGDLQKGPRGTNQHKFHHNAWFPPDSRGGELAESWEVQRDPLRLVFHLRKGIKWQEKPGVMKSREFVADDVVYSMTRIKNSPKAIPLYLDFVDRFEATDKYTVTAFLKEWSWNWWYRFGMGYYDAIEPPEMEAAGPRKWENLCGTGPFMLTDYVSGSAMTFSKNNNYWGKEPIEGKEYQLPFCDTIKEMLIRDPSTRLSALRTGKVDLMHLVDFRDVKNLKKTNPELKWDRVLSPSPLTLALRMDTKPFDDIRVRQALNLAVNQQEIVDAYFEGEAELIGYPYPASWPDYHTPLKDMPPEVKELFSYDPKKAKKLLAEAGYPNGFKFTTQVNSGSQVPMEIAQMVTAYLAQIGVTMELEPMQYSAYLSKMTSKTHTPGYLFSNDHGNPFATIRKNFLPGQTWNPYMFNDEWLAKKWHELVSNPDLSEEVLIKELKALNVYVMGKAPAVWLPGGYQYVAWWPWVKNYYGEQRVGAIRPGPIWARIWIDQQLKKKMGY